MNQRIAIYARYSTDKQDKSSIDGQIKNCRFKAKELGCKVGKIFKDEAMGGDDPNRPGFRALIEAMECGDYDGVIVDDADRFSRDGWSLQKFSKELTFRQQFMVDCAGYDSRDETSKLVAAVKSAIAEMELKKTSRRVYRGVRERADKGYSAGGCAYGFKRPGIDPETGEKIKRQWQKHEKDPYAAKVVVDIFNLYAGGASCRAIASELNRRKLPSPGASWKRKSGNGKPTDGKWRASSINVMLDNEIYNGRYVWNKRQFVKNPNTGKRECRMRPQGEWKVEKLPFKIVEDKLWLKVKARRDDLRRKNRAARRKNGGRKCGNGRLPKYVLSGLLKCDSCGSNFVMRDTRRYKCASQCNGAESACDNTLSTIRVHAEKEIIGAVGREILSDKNIDKILRSAIKQASAMHAGEKGTEDVTALRNRIADIERQLANLADAIALSGFTDALRAKHSALEAELKKQNARLAVASGKVVPLPKLEVNLRDGLTKLRQNLGRLHKLVYGSRATPMHVARLRNSLGEFLGKIPLRPDYDVGALIATLGPKNEALALLAGTSAVAYRSGSGGKLCIWIHAYRASKKGRKSIDCLSCQS